MGSFPPRKETEGSEAEFRHIYRGYHCWQLCRCGTSVSRQQFGLSAAYEIVYECDSLSPCSYYARRLKQNTDVPMIRTQYNVSDRHL